MKPSLWRSRPPGAIGDGTRFEDGRSEKSKAREGRYATGAAVSRWRGLGAARIAGALIVVSAGIGLAFTPVAGSTASRAANSGLADSVMATVGARSITVSEFWRMWRETHPGSATDTLTPQSVRGFLEVLIDRELISTAAGRARWTWSPADSAAYAARADRITLSAALESALAEARAASGDPKASLETVGVLARERAMTALAPVFEDTALARIARGFAAIPLPVSDSSLAAQLRTLAMLPEFDPDERATVLARSATAGIVTVEEILKPWSRLSPAYRPRIETAGQVKDLAENILFERWLRLETRSPAHAGNAAIARALARERELMDVQHLMTRSVHAIDPPTPETLDRYYRGRAADWIVPARWRVIRLESDDRAAATRWALLLRDPVAAESLVTRAARQGVRYRLEIRAATDSTLFARASSSGAGTVLGPDAVKDGWEVVRVEALIPARTPAWADIRGQVEERWYADESARRLANLLARERRRHRVRIGDGNPDAATAGGPTRAGELTEP